MLATLPILALLATTAPDFDKLIEKGRAALVIYDVNAAEKAYAEACPAEIAESLPPDEIAFCEHGWGVISDLRGQSDEAAGHYIKALANWEVLGGSFLTHRIKTLTALGASYRRQGRVTDAERVLSEAFALAKPFAQSDPELTDGAQPMGALYGEPGGALAN